MMLALWVYHSQAATNYSTVKAFYGLFLVGPLSIFFALGLQSIINFFSEKRFVFVRALIIGWLGTLTGTIYLSYASL
jgi:hypothetical protein